MKIDKENTQAKTPKRVRNREQVSRLRSVEIDVDAYQSLLDQTGLTGEQRAEFLEAMWSIIVAFIDLGFEVHPVQQSIGKTEPRPHLMRIANEFVRDAA
ncbi:hypothetical protein [Shimia sp. SDUM112013]|uniref:hypothetical protein n=1 Tax=Shimia sp. SDUM112013 TaxID=3136160 RepID=UPI0032EDB80D